MNSFKSDFVSTSKYPDTKRSATRLLRILLPTLIILTWFVLAGVGGPYFGRIDEVSSNDQTAYLPESADATQVRRQLDYFRDSDTIPAVVVIVSDDVLTTQQTEMLQERATGLAEVEGVADGVSPPIPSNDGLALEVFVPIESGADVGSAVAQIGEYFRDQLPESIAVYVTGPAGFPADLLQAFSGIDGLLLAVALLTVFLILIIVYRSLLLPVAVLSTSLFALSAALLVVWWLANAGIVLLSGQTQGILFILVIGAATDYSLLYIARYREALRVEQDHWVATKSALGGSFEPILASGGTVITGLLCLLLSDLKSNSALGPVASIGIIFAILAALTLLPAILFALGRKAFWPRQPNYEDLATADKQALPTTGIWTRICSLIQNHHRQAWALSTVFLVIGAVGVTQFRAGGVSQSDLVLTSSEARDGQVALGKHFPAGSGSPLYVLTPEYRLLPTAATLLGNTDIDSVSVMSVDSVSGSLPVTTEGIGTVGPPGTAVSDPTVVDGNVMLQATLMQPADSAEAEQIVRDLRTELAKDGPETLVGGVTATAVDTKDTAIHDRNLIIPIVLAVILLILILLLRSVVAPVLLISTTVLSFATALGVSALVFNSLLKLPGADPSVPLYGFVFLVALGIDYNIFLSTRVREESKKYGTREGTLRGLSVTGGVITSAGLVLAATFASLAVLPILFLLQLAFIVSFGVLLDTFLVRALLVPALFYDIGPKIWWPSKLSRWKATAGGKP
ncbi:MAG: efflux RND transporter permease subunit [Scrofimicrobium sp.]